MTGQNDQRGSAMLRLVDIAAEDETAPCQSFSPQSCISEAGESVNSPAPTRSERLHYIEGMALTLKEMAEADGFDTLTAILEIAYTEAGLRRAEEQDLEPAS